MIISFAVFMFAFLDLIYLLVIVCSVVSHIDSVTLKCQLFLFVR